VERGSRNCEYLFPAYVADGRLEACPTEAGFPWGDDAFWQQVRLGASQKGTFVSARDFQLCLVLKAKSMPFCMA